MTREGGGHNFEADYHGINVKYHTIAALTVAGFPGAFVRIAIRNRQWQAIETANEQAGGEDSEGVLHLAGLVAKEVLMHALSITDNYGGHPCFRLASRQIL